MFSQVYMPGQTVLNVDTVGGGPTTRTFVTHKPYTTAGPNACNMQVCISRADVTNGKLTINVGTYDHDTDTFTIAATNPRKAYIADGNGHTRTVFIGYVTPAKASDYNPSLNPNISPAFQVITETAGAKAHVYVEGVVLPV